MVSYIVLQKGFTPWETLADDEVYIPVLWNSLPLNDRPSCWKRCSWFVTAATVPYYAFVLAENLWHMADVFTLQIFLELRAT